MMSSPSVMLESLLLSLLTLSVSLFQMLTTALRMKKE